MFWRRTYIAVYDDELSAVLAVAPEMRALTDRDKREYAVFIQLSSKRSRIGGAPVGPERYLVGRPIRGAARNVVRTAIFHALMNFMPWVWAAHRRRRRKILVHTHPNTPGFNNNIFSGDPRKWWQFGDVSVPTLLRYQSIYLVAPNGKLYRYDGRGEGPTRASSLKALHALPPIATYNDKYCKVCQ